MQMRPPRPPLPSAPARLIILWLICLSVAPAAAARQDGLDKYRVAKEPRKLALVIGNSAYEDGSGLTTVTSAGTDAERMRERLIDLGFTVDYYCDVRTSDAFENLILDSFKRKLSKGDWVVVYFSGHGLSYGAGNYILPTQMRIPVPKNLLSTKALLWDGLINALARREPGLIMVFSDACRTVSGVVDENTTGVFEETTEPPGGWRLEDWVGCSVVNIPEREGGDVAPLTLPTSTVGVNTMIFYATQPGSFADGFNDATRLSRFTHALYNRIGTAGRPFSSVFNQIMADVWGASLHSQKPFPIPNSITDPYLRPDQRYLDQEWESWDGILRNGQREEIEQFFYLHSVSRFAAGCLAWLADHPPAPYTGVSPAAVERAWDVADGHVAILSLREQPLELERTLEAGEGQSPEMLSDEQLGLVSARTSKVIGTPQRSLLSFYLGTLDNHRTVVATKALRAFAEPRAGAAELKPIRSGTTLEVNNVIQVSDTVGYVGATPPGADAPVFVRVESPAELTVVRPGNALKEIMAPPRPDSIPDLVDPVPITEALAELKAQGWTVTWVSLATAAAPPGDEKRLQDALRAMRLANAEHILKNAGIKSVSITSVSGTKDFSGDGVRIRFFGVK